MIKELDRMVISLKDEMFKSASEIIRFKSVQGVPESDAPFGIEVKKALEYALNIGEKYGFKTRNVDNYAGHVEFGESGNLFGVLGHLDVVPEGQGWSVSPYDGVIKDGYLWGRGAIDDKGPTIAALFALIAVKKIGVEPKDNRVRLIFGTNEETGWEGLKHYFKREEMPNWGVTPDADFPIINAEKGIVNFKISASLKNASSNGNIVLTSLEGGEASNMVASHAKAILKSKEESVGKFVKDFKKINFIKSFKPFNGARMEVKLEGDELIVESFGKSAHGAKPDEGTNAISALLELLSNLNLGNRETDKFLKKLKEKIGYETDGKSLGISGNDDISGKLTVNLGTIKVNEEKIEAVINIRYPIFFNVDMIETQIKEALNGMNVERQHHQKPLYVSPDSELVKVLSEVYEDVTKQRAYLIAIGGGTYARAIPNAAAFGPLFPGREETEHQPNERISLDDLLMNARIYAQLLYRILR